MSSDIDRILEKFTPTHKYGVIPSYESPRVDGWQIRLFWARANGYRWQVDLNKATLAMGDKHYGLPRQALEELLVTNDSDAHTAIKCVFGDLAKQTKGANMKRYEQRTIQTTVLPVGEPIFSEQATRISIEDESGGEFVEISQDRGDNRQAIRLDVEEWPAIRSAVDAAVESIHNTGGDGMTTTTNRFDMYTGDYNPNGDHELLCAVFGPVPMDLLGSVIHVYDNKYPQRAVCLSGQHPLTQRLGATMCVVRPARQEHPT